MDEKEVKVCLVNLFELDPPRNGGLSRVAFIVSDLMAQMDKRGDAKVFFAVGWRFSGQFRNWLGRPGGEIIPVLPEAGITPFLQALRPDLIISPLFGMAPLGDWDAYRGIPHIASIPDALALDKPELFSPVERARRHALYHQLKEAAMVVTISSDARRRLMQHLGLQPERITTIPLAGDLSKCHADGGAASADNVAISAPYILYPARNWPHKRHELLFKAMRDISRVRDDLKLVLTGWHDPTAIEDLARRCQLAKDRIVALSYVSNSTMIALYRKAEALMFVSEYEGFGMPILEAMQNGCPVLCAPVTSIPEVAGNAALYVDSDDPADWAAAFLVELPSVRAKLIRQGYKQAQKFSWSQTQARWQNLIVKQLGNAALQPRLPLPYAQEMQIWADWYRVGQQELSEKEEIIQSLQEQISIRATKKAQLQPGPLDPALFQQVCDENEALQDNLKTLQNQLYEKEKVIQNFRTSFLFGLEHGPFRGVGIFRVLLPLAARLRNVRRYFLPKVGVLDQHPPISLELPEHYKTSHPVDFARVLLPLAARLRNVRRYFLPKVGVLDQHPPISLELPEHYKTSHPVDSARLPRISIVTPSYRQAAFIERTVKSVLDQEYPHLEYVIQDGGSTDGTMDILQPYLSRLTHFESRKDRGQAHAINLGFRHTSGEIMAYLNSDDILLPGSLNYVADYFIRHPDVDVIYSHRVIIDENDREIGRWILPPHDNNVILWADYVPQETLFWRRRIWEKAGGHMDESYQFALDWDMLIRFRDAGAKMVRVPRFLAAFRVQSAQKTSMQMSGTGLLEMNRLRTKIHHREVDWIEIAKKIKPYLRRSVWYHGLYRLGILRY